MNIDQACSIYNICHKAMIVIYTKGEHARGSSADPAMATEVGVL